LTDVAADMPGMLTAQVLRDNPDSGFELYLKFDKKGELPGGINYVTATAVDEDGKNYEASSDLRALYTPPPSPPAPSEEKAARGHSAPEATGIRDYGAELKSDVAPGANAETDAAPLAQGPAPKAENATMEGRTAGDGSTGEAGKRGPAGTRGMEPATDAAAPGVTRNKSVLQRFEGFKGKKELKAFAALFERQGPRMVQEPEIALSDGKAPVTIKLELRTDGGLAPNFLLSDAKLVSLRKGEGKEWIITAVPHKGAWKAGLTIRTGQEEMSFPLVVAPPADIRKGINEKDFLAALDAYIAAQAAEHKEESVPSRRAFQEYVFTANYLAKRTAGKIEKTEGLTPR
jgi:hypothetical protein